MDHAPGPTASADASVGDGPASDPGDVGSEPRRTRYFELLLLFTVTGFAVQGMVPPSDPQAVVVTALVGISLLLAVRVGELPSWFFRAVVVLSVYGFSARALRRLDRAISTILPTPPPSTVLPAAVANPRICCFDTCGGIDSAFGSVTTSTSTGPSVANAVVRPSRNAAGSSIRIASIPTPRAIVA